MIKSHGKATYCHGKVMEINDWISMGTLHLVNLVDATLSDSLDCRYQCSMFIGYVNKSSSKFGHLQPKVLLNLFNTYCCYFYGSSRWGLHSNGFNLCITAWNIGVRKILDIPCITHTWMLESLTSYVHMKYILYIRDLFLTKFSQCDNVLSSVIMLIILLVIN